MSRRGVVAADTDAEDLIDLNDGITQLSKQNAKLERMLSRIGTAADDHHFRDTLNSEQQSGAALARRLLAALKAQTRTSSAGADTRQAWMRKVEKEYKRFVKLAEQIDEKQKEQLRAASFKDGSALSESGGDGQEQTQAFDSIQFVKYDVEEIESRHTQIRAIEREVGELAEMFKDLATMVDEQQEHIDIIDQNIQATKDRVEEGMKELEQAETYQKKSRKKACCVLLSLLILIGVIVIIVYAANGTL